MKLDRRGDSSKKATQMSRFFNGIFGKVTGHTGSSDGTGGH